MQCDAKCDFLNHQRLQHLQTFGLPHRKDFAGQSFEVRRRLVVLQVDRPYKLKSEFHCDEPRQLPGETQPPLCPTNTPKSLEPQKPWLCQAQQMRHCARHEKCAFRSLAGWLFQVRLALISIQEIQPHGAHHNEAIRPPMWHKRLP